MNQQTTNTLTLDVLKSSLAIEPLAVTLGNGIIDETDGYEEVGMRCHILSIDYEDSDYIHLKVSYAEFDEYNKAFETANYHDADGNACLYAREVGAYKTEDTLYVKIESLGSVITILELARYSLLQEFLADPAGATSYTDFLENKIFTLRAKLEGQ